MYNFVLSHLKFISFELGIFYQNFIKLYIHESCMCNVIFLRTSKWVDDKRQYPIVTIVATLIHFSPFFINDEDFVLKKVFTDIFLRQLSIPCKYLTRTKTKIIAIVTEAICMSFLSLLIIK
jgi:hypothetical protein